MVVLNNFNTFNRRGPASARRSAGAQPMRNIYFDECHDRLGSQCRMWQFIHVALMDGSSCTTMNCHMNELPTSATMNVSPWASANDSKIIV